MSDYKYYTDIAKFLEDKLMRYDDLGITPVYTDSDIVPAIDAIRHLVKQARHYEKEHNAQVTNSIKHSNNMIGDMLKVALDPNSLINKGLQKVAEENSKLKKSKKNENT